MGRDQLELSLDTSTNFTGIALTRQGTLVAEMNWNSDYQQTAELLPALDFLFQHTRATEKMLDAIFVASGPGGFTSLRVGISVAKGLAFSLQVPLVGIGTLELSAFPFIGFSLPIRALIPLGRSDLATALFQAPKGELVQVQEPRMTSLEEVIAETHSPTLFCGEAQANVATNLKEALKDLAVIPHLDVNLPRVRAVAQLGWHQLQRGQVDNPATLQPFYLRKPSITIKGEKVSF